MRKGYTLIELIVVILILGILAAVAAPKIFRASGDATDNGIKQTLAVVRDAISLYAAQNGGTLPGADGTETTFKKNLSPYLRSFPACPVGPALNDQVLIVFATTPLSPEVSPVRSWKYSAATGEFIINFKSPTLSDPTVRYDEL